MSKRKWFKYSQKVYRFLSSLTPDRWGTSYVEILILLKYLKHSNDSKAQNQLSSVNDPFSFSFSFLLSSISSKSKLFPTLNFWSRLIWLANSCSFRIFPPFFVEETCVFSSYAQNGGFHSKLFPQMAPVGKSNWSPQPHHACFQQCCSAIYRYRSCVQQRTLGDPSAVSADV